MQKAVFFHEAAVFLLKDNILATCTRNGFVESVMTSSFLVLNISDIE